MTIFGARPGLIGGRYIVVVCSGMLVYAYFGSIYYDQADTVIWKSPPFGIRVLHFHVDEEL